MQHKRLQQRALSGVPCLRSFAITIAAVDSQTLYSFTLLWRRPFDPPSSPTYNNTYAFEVIVAKSKCVCRRCRLSLQSVAIDNQTSLLIDGDKCQRNGHPATDRVSLFNQQDILGTDDDDRMWWCYYECSFSRCMAEENASCQLPYWSCPSWLKGVGGIVANESGMVLHLPIKRNNQIQIDSSTTMVCNWIWERMKYTI